MGSGRRSLPAPDAIRRPRPVRASAAGPPPRAPAPAPLSGGITVRNQSATQPVAPGPRRWGRWVALALVALMLIAGRVLHDSWSALRAGQAAEAGGPGQRSVAIRHYLRAARMYLPASPFVGRALGRLEALAQAAAAAGDRQGEREALEAVRSAVLGARSLYTPHGDRLAAADRRLAALYAEIEDPAVAPGATRAEREAWHRDRLAARPGPGTAATLVALGGFGLWLAAVVVFIRRGLDRGLRLERRWALASVLGFGLGFTLFVLGLRLG